MTNIFLSIIVNSLNLIYENQMKLKEKRMLKSLLGKKELSDSYVNFQSDLLEMLQNLRQKERVLEAAFPKPAAMKNKLNEGIPLIGFTPLSLSQKVLTEGYHNLIKIFTTHKIWTKDVAARVEKKSNQSFIKKLTKASISFDTEEMQKLASTIPLEAATLMLLGEELVKPFFYHLLARTNKTISFENWKEGFCPVCGDKPRLSILSKDEDGKKYLWCARCESEWTFPRITCPFCKNIDHTKLRFLSTNFREELRLDVCEICKGYTKTIDERKINQEEKPDLFKENIASLYLDILAEDNGYYVQPPPKREIKIKFFTD